MTNQTPEQLKKKQAEDNAAAKKRYEDAVAGKNPQDTSVYIHPSIASPSRSHTGESTG